MARLGPWTKGTCPSASFAPVGCKGNAAVPHGNVFCKFYSQSLAVFDDTNVVGRRKFSSTAKNIKGFTVFLGDRRISRRIVTGELQVYFTVFTNNVVSRSNLIDFKLFIVVSGNGQLISIQLAPVMYLSCRPPISTVLPSCMVKVIVPTPASVYSNLLD